MAEEQSTAQETQGETEGQVQKTTEERPASPAEAQEETEAKTYNEEYVKSLRREAAGYRTRLSAAEKRMQQLEDSQDAEASAVREENDGLKSENEKLKGQIRRAAFIEMIGLKNPRAAWGYVLDGTVEVEYDDNNRPQGIDAIRKKLQEEEPELFGGGSADGGARTQTEGFNGQPGRDRLTYAYGKKQ